MAERLVGSRPTVFRKDTPVSAQEAAPTIAVATSLHPDLAQWHRQNLRELYDFQKTNEEGCFFIGLYALSAALHPERELPSANDFLSEIRPRYGYVLEPEKLLVPNNKLAQAFGIYDDWGIRVTRLTRNAKAEEVLCENLFGYQQLGLIRDTHTFAPIDVTQYKPPFAVWMHEGITKQVHFATIDGSQEAQDMVNDYTLNKKYFVKMAIEVAVTDQDPE